MSSAIVYPDGLPGPTEASVQASERRVLSSAPPFEARNLQRDRLATQQITLGPMTAAQLAVFEAWGKDTLVYWGAWFASPWPLPSGEVGVRRFIAPPRREFIGGGYWRITANFEVRGRGKLPEQFEAVRTQTVTWNPATKWFNIALSNADLTATIAEYDPFFGEDIHGGAVFGTVGKSAGKWYFEIHFNNCDGNAGQNYSSFGISNLAETVYAYVGSNGFVGRSGAVVSPTATLNTGDTVRIAFDVDTGKVWLGKNAAWIGGGDPVAGASPTVDFGAALGTTVYPQSKMVDHQFDVLTLRTKASEFDFSIPSGFLAYEIV